MRRRYSSERLEPQPRYMDLLRGPTLREPSPTKAASVDGLRPRVYERDGYRCVTCGSPKSLTLDHWIPRSKGGRTSYANLKTMCRPCNAAKADTLPPGLVGAR